VRVKSIRQKIFGFLSFYKIGSVWRILALKYSKRLTRHLFFDYSTPLCRVLVTSMW